MIIRVRRMMRVRVRVRVRVGVRVIVGMSRMVVERMVMVARRRRCQGSWYRRGVIPFMMAAAP